MISEGNLHKLKLKSFASKHQGHYTCRLTGNGHVVDHIAKVTLLPSPTIPNAQPENNKQDHENLKGPGRAEDTQMQPSNNSKATSEMNMENHEYPKEYLFWFAFFMFLLF